MSRIHKDIFFLNGRVEHWLVGRKKSIWGLQLLGLTWSKAKARLQELDFRAGSEILATSGPWVHFRAVVGSDRGVFFDDESAPWGFGPRKEIYPVRIELTNIEEINKYWFSKTDGPDWQYVLKDVYFQRRNLYIPATGFENHPNVLGSVVFGERVTPD
jgi:hypothetical protein